MSKRLERFAPEVLGASRILVGILLGLPWRPEDPRSVRRGPGRRSCRDPVDGRPDRAGWRGPIALGLFPRQAAFLMSGLMAVAYFMAHAPRGFWPILNGGEVAIVYSWFSLYLVARGPGAWAIDNVRAARVMEADLRPAELREHAAH